ncbi:MAG: hypothetical protein Q9213_003605 [Squamulea squamosa]
MTGKMGFENAHTQDAEHTSGSSGSNNFNRRTVKKGSHVAEFAAGASGEYGLSAIRQIATCSAVSNGPRLGTNVSNVGSLNLENHSQTAWPDVGIPGHRSLELHVPAQRDLFELPNSLFIENQTELPAGRGNICRPNGTQRTYSNDSSFRENRTGPLLKETISTLGKPASSTLIRAFTFEQPRPSSGRQPKHDLDSEIHKSTLESALKKPKFNETTLRTPVLSKRLSSDRSTGVVRSHRRPTKGEVLCRQQAEFHRRQKTAVMVKAEMDDEEMKDVGSAGNQADGVMPLPTTFGGRIDTSVLQQSGLAASSSPLNANIYASLKSARKRVHQAENPNVKPGIDYQQAPEGGPRQETASNGRIDRPHAPPLYARNSTRRRASTKSVLETRKTYYSAEIYQQFASMPNETKSCTRSEEEALRGIKPLVENCIDAVQRRRDTKEAFAELRDRLHRVQFYDFLSKHLIEKTKVFELSSIGAVIINEDNIFPWDLQADARILAKQVFTYGCDPHLLRGVITTQNLNDKKCKSYSIERSYPFLASANFVGGGDLINGQWWPKRVCALRDGAHGAIEAGIYGETGKGAYSIIVGGESGYDDVDDGEELQYCGTSSDKKDAHGASIPTANTTRMLESCDRLHNEIRVLRKAAGSGKHSTYNPSCGLRYDGLYRITGKELLHAETSMYRFKLKRMARQDPIRFKGPEQRPTYYEKRKYDEMFNN